MSNQVRELVDRYGVYGLLVITAIILFTQLGTYPLQMQWEPNYGQVVREMVWGEGDIITPTCKVGSDEGAKPGTFWSKPIMIFWLAYPFYAIFGDSEWCARIPIALVGLFAIMMTYWFMTRLYTRRLGLLAGLLLATTPSYFLISRAYMVDMPFVGFMWVAIGFLLVGEKEGRNRWYYLFYFFMGLSALAKGLIPLILVGGTIFFYCLISMDWGLLKRMKMHVGIPIFLVVASPWYIYMTQKYGFPYLKKFFWDHHVQRSLGKLDKPDDSFEMFVLYFSIGVLPWITFLPQAVANTVPWFGKATKENKTELFFLTGFLVAFTFFSTISTKFVHYIFPAVPYTIMLIAIYIDKLIDAEDNKNLSRIIFFVALLVLIIVAPDLLDQKNYRTLFYFITTERLQDWHPSVADPTKFFSVIFAIWGLVLAVAFFIRRFHRAFLTVLVALAIAYSFYINMIMIPSLTEMFGARSLVEKYMELRTGPDEPIGEFTQTWKSRSIKYYMEFDELKDKYNYRNYRIRNNKGSVKRYYERYKGKRVFIIIEQKQKHFNRINALWQEVSGGEQLFKLFDDAVPGEPYRPEFWLISNRDKSGKKQILSQAEIQEKLRKFIRKEPFVPERKLLATIENQIELIGHSEFPQKVKAGQDVEITLYFHAKKKITRDWKVFLHAEKGKVFRLRGDHVPVEGSYPSSRWKKGEYIRDVFKMEIPPDTAEGRLNFYTGLYQGNYRAKISEIRQKDDEGRIKIGSVQIVK